MRRAIVEISDQVIALADHTKFGRAYSSNTVLPHEITRLIMDSDLPPDQATQVREVGIALELA